MDWQESVILRKLFSADISRWTFDTNNTDIRAGEMSKLSSAVCTLSASFPRQNLFCYHPGNQLCLSSLARASSILPGYCQKIRNG